MKMQIKNVAFVEPPGKLLAVLRDLSCRHLNTETVLKVGRKTTQ